eukprot:c31809_g1_i1 orf=102-275(+)
MCYFHSLHAVSTSYEFKSATALITTMQNIKRGNIVTELWIESMFLLLEPWNLLFLSV